HSTDCGHDLSYMAAALDGVVGPVASGVAAVVQCNLEVLLKAGVRLFGGADGVLLADVVPAEATAAVMGASAAAAGSADVPASAAGADGAEAEDADTEPSSSDSELPDTTAPAVAKAEERSGAAVAAPQERSPADVDMASDMTDAAVADPSLTVGELVDKTKQKLEYMSAYMEGASRMVGFEGALASRAGDDHRRVLEHAAKLLQKSEEFLQDQAAEAGVAASGAPSSGGAAPSSDARLLEGIDAFMGNSSATKAEDQDRTGPHLHRQH
ncbi:pol, partial [Symbiodinium sp. KB8]